MKPTRNNSGMSNDKSLVQSLCVCVVCVVHSSLYLCSSFLGSGGFKG